MDDAVALVADVFASGGLHGAVLRKFLADADLRLAFVGVQFAVTTDVADQNLADLGGGRVEAVR